MKLYPFIARKQKRKQKQTTPHRFAIEILETRVMPSVISILGVTHVEGNSGLTQFDFAVSLDAVSAGDVTVDYAIADGVGASAATAADGDYIPFSSTVTIHAGELSTNISVFVSGDTKFEQNETFTVDLSNPTGGASISAPQGTGTITNDDNIPTITINDVSKLEGNAGTSPMIFTVTLSNPSYQNIAVNYSTAQDTATAPADYTTNVNTLGIASGATSGTISVQIVGDTTFEANEDFFVNLNSSVNASIADNQATGTILNDEPGFVITDVTLDEGTSGNANFTFLVTLTFPVGGETYNVDYATANGTATTGNTDYVAKSGTLTFGPGTTVLPISVSVTGDTTSEASETFFVNLSNPTTTAGALPGISDAQGVGTIVNDDALISTDDASLAEGNGGTFFNNFHVTLANASSQTVTVSYTTANNSATLANNDYLAASGILTFLPGETLQIVAVGIVGDLKVEPTETFFLNLSSAASSPLGSANIADNQGIGTIVNDDGSLLVTEVADANDAVNDQNLGFGGVKVGQSGVRTFTIQNVTSQPLTIASWGSSESFFLTPANLVNNSSDDVTLTPNQSLVLTVAFVPTSVNGYSGFINLVSSNPATLLPRIGLTGHGRFEDTIQTNTTNNRLVYTDSLGNRNSLSFNGPGQALVSFGDFNGVGSDINSITFSTTTTKTHYRIGSTSLTNIATIANSGSTSTGFGRFYAAANITGGVNWSTSIATISNFRVLGSVTGVNIAGTIGSFRVGDLVGTNNFSSDIKSLRVDRIANGNINIATTSLTSAVVDKINLGLPIDLNTGTLVPTNVVLKIQGSLGSLQDAGVFNGALITTDSIGTISAPSFNALLSAGYGLDGIRNSDVFENALASIGKINAQSGALAGVIQAKGGLGEIVSSAGISTGTAGGEIFSGASITGIKARNDINVAITAIGTIHQIKTLSTDHAQDGDLLKNVTAGAIQSVILEGLLGQGVILTAAPVQLVKDFDHDLR